MQSRNLKKFQESLEQPQGFGVWDSDPMRPRSLGQSWDFGHWDSDTMRPRSPGQSRDFGLWDSDPMRQRFAGQSRDFGHWGSDPMRRKSLGHSRDLELRDTSPRDENLLNWQDRLDNFRQVNFSEFFCLKIYYRFYGFWSQYNILYAFFNPFQIILSFLLRDFYKKGHLREKIAQNSSRIGSTDSEGSKIMS